MPSANIVRSTPVIRSARVLQLEGLFEIAPTKRSEMSWQVALPIEEKAWNIGLIVGPSGCGKSTLAREMFGSSLVDDFDWSKERSIVDCFPDNLGIKDITGLLSSVGFSSPPSWLRPFSVLSTGEQFRATTNEFTWRLVRRRPDIKLEITRVHRSAWELFKHHHYLDHGIHKGSACYLGCIEDTPAAFTAVLSFPHASRPGYREHRNRMLA